MKKMNRRWILTVTLMSAAISIVFTFASSQVLGSAGYILSFAVLLLFILLGIVFDIIGVAVTAATPAPFHSMASHRERGASEALRLIKNAEKVSSVCNDIVGDISGIVSGTTSAIIAARLMQDLSAQGVFIQLAISGLVAGLTIGGKAVGKAIAINNSTKILLLVGKLLSFKVRRKNEGN